MLKIGQIADKFQIKSDTLRFYEKHGLLAPSERSDSGYRLYNVSDEAKLSFILRAKSVGFSLNDIHDLLSIELDKSNWACGDVKVLVDKKLVEIQQKLAELKKFEMSLQSLSNACCGGPESAEHCSILDALEDTHVNR